jgi:hypothetical protein
MHDLRGRFAAIDVGCSRVDTRAYLISRLMTPFAVSQHTRCAGILSGTYET